MMKTGKSGRRKQPPNGLFKSVNIMTQKWRGYFKLTKGWAELSEGRGIVGEPIFGVTVRPDPDHLSKMFHDRDAAQEYITSLGGKVE